jgi:LemA protein
MSHSEIVTIAGLALMAFWMLGAYNRLVRLRQAIAAAFAHLDAHFRQRHDLLAELIEAVAGALTRTAEEVAAVEAARRQTRIAADHAALRPAIAGRLASLALAEQVLREALSRLMTQVKADPALYTDARLRAVTKELSKTQHSLAVGRDGFNVAVLDYNRGVQQFPTRLIAGMFGFRVAGKL